MDYFLDKNSSYLSAILCNKNAPHYYLWNFKIPQVKQNIQSLNFVLGLDNATQDPNQKNKIALHHAQAYRKVLWYCI